MTIFSSKMKWYFSIGFFSSFFISKSKFLIEISILQRKSDLLKCIMLMQLKNFEKWRGSKSCKCRFLAPLLLCHFLSDINMMSLKRSHFSSKIDVSRKKKFEIEKIEQHQIKKCHFILLLKMVILLRDFLKISNGLKAKKVRVVQF